MQLSCECFVCTGPLSGRRGFPTTARLLCITAKSLSNSAYSAVVCAEKVEAHPSDI